MLEPRQLVLDLPHRPALAAEDFLVSDANRAAVALIDRWPDWPQASALVVGPARSGKSHLANVWRLRAGAEASLSAARIDEAAITLLQRSKALVIEDLEQGIGSERVLFHLLNLANEAQAHLLLTSGRAPEQLEISLPDLRSRLRALALVRIETPDEGLLRALLVKLFNDRQLIVEPHVIEHLALHVDRSMATAARIVAEIDRRALASKRKVTRALAAEVLALLSPAEPEGAAD